jgi:hypothetical protein
LELSVAWEERGERAVGSVAGCRDGVVWIEECGFWVGGEVGDPCLV